MAPNHDGVVNANTTDTHKTTIQEDMDPIGLEIDTPEYSKPIEYGNDRNTSLLNLLDERLEEEVHNYNRLLSEAYRSLSEALQSTLEVNRLLSKKLSIRNLFKGASIKDKRHLTEYTHMNSNRSKARSEAKKIIIDPPQYLTSGILFNSNSNYGTETNRKVACPMITTPEKGISKFSQISSNIDETNRFDTHRNVNTDLSQDLS